MTDGPLLTVRPPAAEVARRRLRRRVVPVALAAVAALVTLLVTGHVALPLEQVVSVDARMASKGDLFDDEQVRKRLLLEHRMRLSPTTRSGSWDIARHHEGADFLFLSGEAQSTYVLDQHREQALDSRRPFLSPLALFTYRPYVEALMRAGVATPLKPPLYYQLDLLAFTKLVNDNKRWSDYGAPGEDRIHAVFPDMCRSNTGQAFLANVAYVLNEHKPPEAADVDAIVGQVSTMLNQSMTTSDVWPIYVSDYGRNNPMIVAYEHQYLGYQLSRRDGIDTDRVVLYPNVVFMTYPRAIAITPKGSALLDILMTDPAIRTRAAELGFRQYERPDPLPGLLRQRDVPEPPVGVEQTIGNSGMPLPSVLDELTRRVGGCRS